MDTFLGGAFSYEFLYEWDGMLTTAGHSGPPRPLHLFMFDKFFNLTSPNSPNLLAHS